MTDTWEDLAPAVTVDSIKPVEDQVTILSRIKALLGGRADLPFPDSNEAIEYDTTKSIYEIAMEKGLTVMEWVQRDPRTALRFAEASLGNWTQIHTRAAIEGVVQTVDGLFAVTKNQTTLLAQRVEDAKRQLEVVNELVFTTAKTDEDKKQHLTRVLYNKAVYSGNLKALTYLIDRVEGKPTETKTAALDFDYAYNIYMIIHELFDKQLEVLNVGNGVVLVCCSRRSGKTYLEVGILLIECMRMPNTTCIYIGETAELSEQLINKAANQLIDKCNLKDKKGNRFNWKKIDNGSQILVRGLSNTKDPDQIRGNNAKVIVIDEFFHLKSDLLEYLVREVLEPMQLDYADNYKFICAGTPPSIKGTYGEFAWKNWNVPHFHWTWRENPHPVSIEARAKYIDNILAEKGLTWDTSYARREYNGEWVYDEDLLLYPVIHTYDPREALPTWHVDQVLFGIDYGVSDNDCIIGIAWDSQGNRGWVFFESKFSRLDITDRSVSQLQYLHKEVKEAWETALDFFPSYDLKEANKRILWDADDNDQHLTDDLMINCRVKDLKLNIRNANKKDRVIMFDKIRDLLRTGNLLLPVDSKVVQECESTVLERGPGGQVYPEVDNSVYHPDLLPAMRYALYNVLM